MLFDILDEVRCVRAMPHLHQSAFRVDRKRWRVTRLQNVSCVVLARLVLITDDLKKSGILVDLGILLVLRPEGLARPAPCEGEHHNGICTIGDDRIQLGLAMDRRDLPEEGIRGELGRGEVDGEVVIQPLRMSLEVAQGLPELQVRPCEAKEVREVDAIMGNICLIDDAVELLCRQNTAQAREELAEALTCDQAGASDVHCRESLLILVEFALEQQAVAF
mmetsp:Transcript_80484/g.209203  ORF Transcript_80484/g.209203 Transcript_80484/m.209203 type:complete len:220 (+) Transcript_80484:745-1404(+)